jgi:hypothetical protein
MSLKINTVMQINMISKSSFLSYYWNQGLLTTRTIKGGTMQAFEFNADIQDNIIKLPEEYRGKLKKKLK